MTENFSDVKLDFNSKKQLYHIKLYQAESTVSSLKEIQ